MCMGVCQVSLCGRDGVEMWNDAPMCREHHEYAVEIKVVRDRGEVVPDSPLLDADDCETLEALLVEAIARAMVLPDEAGPSGLIHLYQVQMKVMRLRRSLPEVAPIPSPF